MGMENATLDEFSVDDEEEPDPDSPEPDTPTASFRPDGAECHQCGEYVVRRWRFDGTLVCVACKDWAKQG